MTCTWRKKQKFGQYSCVQCLSNAFSRHWKILSEGWIWFMLWWLTSCCMVLIGTKAFLIFCLIQFWKDTLYLDLRVSFQVFFSPVWMWFSISHLQCCFGLLVSNGKKRISLWKHLALHMWESNWISICKYSHCSYLKLERCLPHEVLTEVSWNLWVCPTTCRGFCR